jgi:hypothetical protein
MTTPSNDWLSEVLEQHASHFNSGKPYITEPKLTELAAEIRRRILEVRCEELQYLLDTYQKGLHPYDFINDRIKELNQRGGNNG